MTLHRFVIFLRYCSLKKQSFKLTAPFSQSGYARSSRGLNTGRFWFCAMALLLSAWLICFSQSAPRLAAELAFLKIWLSNLHSEVVVQVLCCCKQLSMPLNLPVVFA